MSDEDYHAAVLTNKILGGGPENRLEQQIREVKSFAYYSRSTIGMIVNILELDLELLPLLSQV